MEYQNQQHARVVDDAQFAADMQMAYDLQAEEELRHRRELNERSQVQISQENNVVGRFTRALSAGRNQRNESNALQLQQGSRRSVSAERNTSSSRPPVVPGRLVAAESVRLAPSLGLGRRSTSTAQSSLMSDGLAMRQYQSLIFVPAEINERMVEMMVDTGAQSSVISAQLMRTLGIQSKLNTSMQGMAQGLGQARILGVIENCPVSIGHVEFFLYFLVLDVPQDMMILGIDQMRRFRCQIDLENEKLVFGGKDGVEVSFLPPEPKREASLRSLSGGGCPVS